MLGRCMKLIAKLFEKLNQTFFSFFSGICVSLALNIFTSILMDSSRDLSAISALAVVLIIMGSGTLILESVVLQNYGEKVASAKIIKMSIDQICNSPRIRKDIIKLLVYLLVSIFLVVSGLVLLYYDFHICITN